MTPRVRVALWLVGACVLTLISVLLDPWVYHHIGWARVYDTDWGRALRTMGYWPTWIVVALAIWRDGQPPSLAAWRGRVLATAVTGVGVAGELIKLVVRRERPNAHDGISVFRPLGEHALSTAGLSMPSSHTLLAFAAATVLARLFPRTTVMWYALAVGCAVTRLLSQAHFLSDVVVGGCLGVAGAYITTIVMPPPANRDVRETILTVEVT